VIKNNGGGDDDDDDDDDNENGEVEGAMLTVELGFSDRRQCFQQESVALRPVQKKDLQKTCTEAKMYSHPPPVSFGQTHSPPPHHTRLPYEQGNNMNT